MGNLSSKLRIGEKIGLSTALVGLLFLAVIWHYHQSLQTVLRDYERLNDVFGAREIYAFEIESALSAARRAEKNFLIERDEALAAEVDTQIGLLLGKTRQLSEIDQDSRLTASEIETLIDVYQQRFHAIADAWRVKGLDHNSGLQGTFRERVHELEDRAGNFNADRLYLQLLQIRRGEKDLGLRREAQYEEQVVRLIEGFRDLVRESALEAGVRERLMAEIAVYEKTFESYADRVLANEDIAGGKGPFRQAAHRIEEILSAHYVPELETNILQLRRREKDYLLRGDDAYVAMARQIAQIIRDQVSISSVSDENKRLLVGLLDAYETNFLALVEQNTAIVTLEEEMTEAANRITPLVRHNVDQASHLTDVMEKKIAESSEESERLNLLIVICAGALGTFLATIITLRIVRPVRQMVGLLDRLTHENPTERIPTVPGARDELNAMAESVNTMADHKAAFVHWWKASMQEAIALRDLHATGTDMERQEIADELRAAAISKVQQLNAIRGQLLRQADRILDVARRIKSGRHGAAMRKETETLEHSTHGISTLLDVVEQEEPR
ncbi:MAG: HAMP domain-containing protein [Pseudomonadota bacterium]|nr:HAMP domain-containing protein [Pseudomonadota bacterium]